MIKKIVLIFITVFICVAPAAMANDGGAYPDFNEYITYTVQTDCKEIAIGEKIEFTITATNHTKADFGAPVFDWVFSDTYISYKNIEEVEDNHSTLKSYSTNQYTFSYVVPENVAWYKRDGVFYIDLCPQVIYSTVENDIEVKKYGLPYDFFQNMIGVEPIPIKLTNVCDGSHLVDMEIMDDNKYFVYSDRYPSDDKESYTYFGEYEGGITNYLSIANISEYSYDVIYIDGYKRRFMNKDNSLILDSKDSIIVETDSETLRMPSQIPEYERVKYNMLFQDADGIYYGVTAEKDCKTLVYEIPEIDVFVAKIEDLDNGNQLVNISVKNISGKEVGEFFVCYSDRFPETKERLLSTIIRGDIASNEVWDIPEIIEIRTLENCKTFVDGGYYIADEYCLRIGYWVDNSLCYWKLFIPTLDIEEGTAKRYTNEDYAYGIYTEVFHLFNDIELYDIEGALSPTPTLQIASTPTPTITPTPLLITPAPTADIGKEVIESVKIENSRSYIIPTWVYIVLLLTAAVVVVLVVYSKRKGDDG